MVQQDKEWDFDRYDWITHDYDQSMRNTGRLRYDETLSRVAYMALTREGDLVLDIGTGTGNLAVQLLRRGCTVIGLDPSVRLLRMAVSKVTESAGYFQIVLCQAPFLQIPFRAQTFDAIVSTYSIHHISDDTKRLAMREMKRVLKSKGRIVIGDVIFRDAVDKGRALLEYPDMEDEYQPTLDTFPDMFKNEGFVVEMEQVADTVWVVCARLG